MTGPFLCRVSGPPTEQLAACITSVIYLEYVNDNSTHTYSTDTYCYCALSGEQSLQNSVKSMQAFNILNILVTMSSFIFSLKIIFGNAKTKEK